MLVTLKVRDLVLIESAELDFVAGLNVLTGETGAGKSILLDALGLATGTRAGTRSNVRPGAQQGSAVAIFDLSGSQMAASLIAENGIVSQDETILRRTIFTDGRTRAFVNDEPVGIALLRDLGMQLAEIHGQADDRGLFDTSTHRRLLDAFGGHEEITEQVATLFEELEKAREANEGLKQSVQGAAAEAHLLRHTVDEISALAPQVGEEEKLATERMLLLNASRIVEDISAVLESLAGESGAESLLAAAGKRLARMRPEGREAAVAAVRAVDQAIAFTEEARQELEGLISRLEVDSSELEKKEERLFGLRAIARKHGVSPEELPRILSEAQRNLESIASSDLELAEADARVARARASFLANASKLSAARAKAARGLEGAVQLELPPLRLGNARFRVVLEPLPEDADSPTGLERVAFEVATIGGAQFGPLSKIASGGELARFSLALKVALAGASPPAALVFDEVDRGVGGAVADAVGERLQRLSKSTQVLLVTHAPQVAARADRHFRIARKGDRTRVELLSAEQRIEEIARMLSGAAVTDEARAAARRLLVEAQTPLKNLRKRA